ncbi:hypothetical protein BDP55DRAFT_725732 [Colletotrichum godetiae]|uniref:Uncharacterized protein n=1 Tax=Colletotrichum godetiae TaxID=1209918 RepID=A0AAJ0AV64_9PEZI|nr:uncharacterized protein BDP55DRAFT_725732 [Colletotrichum godetiae]KAK1689581.1 hypothetical protein BDP55DRAFT_725732 [Colletotrichum godetiae]
MGKHTSKQSSSKSKSSGSRPSNGNSSSSSSTVPVDRPWQDASLHRSQTTATTTGSPGSLLGRWLTEPAHQGPFNTIAEVPAAGSAAGHIDGRQGSGASATCATSQQQPR